MGGGFGFFSRLEEKLRLRDCGAVKLHSSALWIHPTAAGLPSSTVRRGRRERPRESIGKGGVVVCSVGRRRRGIPRLQRTSNRPTEVSRPNAGLARGRHRSEEDKERPLSLLGMARDHRYPMTSGKHVSERRRGCFLYFEGIIPEDCQEVLEMASAADSHQTEGKPSTHRPCHASWKEKRISRLVQRRVWRMSVRRSVLRRSEDCRGSREEM